MGDWAEITLYARNTDVQIKYSSTHAHPCFRDDDVLYKKLGAATQEGFENKAIHSVCHFKWMVPVMEQQITLTDANS